MPFVGPAGKRVVFANEQDLAWLPLRDTPGFGGADIPGVFCKFFGKEEHGPWFYLVRHEPNVVVARHTHEGDVFHYLLEGEWHIGSRKFLPGFMQYEQKGLYYGPIISGDQGSLFLAIYDHAPSFIEAREKGERLVPHEDYLVP